MFATSSRRVVSLVMLLILTLAIPGWVLAEPEDAAVLVETRKAGARMLLDPDDILVAIPEATAIAELGLAPGAAVELPEGSPFRVDGSLLVAARQLVFDASGVHTVTIVSADGDREQVEIMLPLVAGPETKTMVGNEVFLQGSYVEVGMAEGGFFGTSGAAPTGFHEIGRSTLGFVADYGRDGWTTGSPAQTGDYFLPGSPFEGWSVKWDEGGTVYGNFGGTTQNFPMQAVTETSAGSTQAAAWVGELTTGSGSLRALQNVAFESDDLFFVMSVTLENIGSTTLTNVRYLRSVDPDQEVDLGGDYSTLNSVHYQPGTTGNPDKALVVANGQIWGLTLGLGTFDSRAVVTTESPWPQDPDAVIGSPEAPSPSSPTNADAAIALAFSLGDLAPGQTVSFSYAYILNADDLDVALGNLEAVTILQPGGTISGTNVPFHATTSDPANTTQVEFFINGTSIGFDTTPDAGGVFGLTFNSTDYPNGTLYKFLKAEATFADGSKASKSATVTIANDGPPVVFVTPISGASVDGDDLPVEVEGTDPLHLPASVSFFRETSGTGSIFLGEITSAPFATTYDTSDLPTDETVVLKAIATDSVGNETVIYTSVTTAINYPPTDITLSPTSVPENSLGGTLVGTLDTIDPNTWDTFTYELLDDAGGRFQISGGQLQVAPGADLNYEVASSHSIEVRSTDSGGHQVGRVFTITVINVAEPLISVADLTVSEGDGTAEVVLTLADPSASPTSVTCATSDGTAVAVEDYTATSAIVTWPGGSGGAQVCSVPIVDDGRYAPSESFSVTLSSPVNGEITDGSAVVTITDDDDPPTIDADADRTVDETDGSIELTVTMTNQCEQTVTVDAATADGSALAGSDYTSVSTVLTWSAGEDGPRTVTVTITDDDIDEDDEAFSLELANPVNAAIGDGQTGVTITDDELVVNTTSDHNDGACTVADCTLREAILASNARAQDDTIRFAIPAGMASGGIYTIRVGGPSGSLGTLPVMTDQVVIDGPSQPGYAGDPIIELDGTLAGFGSNGLTVLAGSSVVDSLVVNRFEGHGVYLAGAGGDQVLGCRIGIDSGGLSPLSNGGNGIYIRDVPNTVIGGAAAGQGNLIGANGLSGIAVESAGAVDGTIEGNVIGVGSDGATRLGNGRHGIHILGASNTTIGGADAGAGNTIANNNVNGILVSTGLGNRIEGNEIHGNTLLGIDLANDGVTANDPMDGDDGANHLQNYPVLTRVTEGSAATGIVGDLASAASTEYAVEFFASSACDPSGYGEAETVVWSTTVTTDAGGGVHFELAAPVTVTAGWYLTATATDPDGNTSELSACREVEAAPSVSIGDVSVTESDGGTSVTAAFAVSLSAPSGLPAEVSWSTADGSAVAGLDYQAAAGTVGFAPGQTSAVVEVTVLGDDLDEFDEVFTVVLGSALDCTIADGVGEGVIVDQDEPPSFAIDDQTVAEGAAGTSVDAVFTVTLSAPSGKPITVDWATADGTATAGADYQAGSGQLSFAPGEMTKTVDVMVTGDDVDEFDETFTVELTGESNATPADALGLGTITDDDDEPSVSIGDRTVTEGASGSTVDATFTVSLSAVSGKAITVDWATADGAATAPADYAAASGQLDFAPGETEHTVAVTVAGDDEDEGDHAASVELSGLVNVGAGDLSGDLLITDDDADVNITKTDGVAEATPGTGHSYTVTVANPGNHQVDDAVVTDNLPAALTGTSWSCVASGGAACDQASGTGNLSTTVDLAPGSSVTFTIDGTIDPSARGALSNTATVALVAGLLEDPNLADNTATDNTSLAPAIDLSIVKSDDADPVIAGAALVYTLEVGNAGPSDATGVEVTDTLPAGVSFVSASPGCVESAGVVACAVGDLAATASTNMVVAVDVDPETRGTISNTAVVSGVETDSDPGNDSDSEDTVVEASADLDLAKEAPVSVSRGDSFDVSLTVTNLGQSDAFGVVVDDPTPQGLTFDGATAPCDGGFPCDLGALEAGASAAITVSLTIPVDYDGPDPITNTASVSAETPDPVSGNNLAATTTAVDRTPEADLVVAKSGPPTVAPGSAITWSVTVTNDGPDQASDAELVDTIPAGLVFASASTGCGEAAGVVTCLLGDLAAHESATVAITATVPVDYAGSDPIVNTATVGSAVADPDDTNDSDSASTALGADTMDLSIIKTAPETAELSDVITYTLTVTNHGPATAVGVVASDVLPAEVAFVSASAGCAEGGGQVDCDFGDLAAGASASATIDVEVIAASGLIVNTATVAAIGPIDADASNNVSSASTAVGELPADVAVTVDLPDEAVPGRELPATVVVTNHGPAAASGVSLDVPAPAGLAELGVSAPCSSGFPCSLGDLAAGSSRIVTVSYAVSSDYAGPDPIVVSATATTLTTDADPANDTGTATTPVLRLVDLAVDLVDLPDPVVAGSGVGNLGYTLTLVNAGPTDASNATVDLGTVLPAGVSVVSVTPVSGSWAGSTWTVASLPAGGSESLIMLLTVDATAAHGAIISATATVTGAAEVLINFGDDTATEMTTVTRAVDLIVDVAESADPVVAGSGAGNVVHTVTVTNAGPSMATGVVLSEILTLPAGASLDSATPSQGGYAVPAWTVGELPVGASATLTMVVTASADAADGSTVDSSAAVTAANEALVNTGDDADFESTTINREVDLAVAVTESVDPVVAGSGAGNLTHVVTVTNHGPSFATSLGLDVTAALPSGVILDSAVASQGGFVAPAWTVGELPVGASATLTLTFSVGEEAVDGAEITTGAAVSGAAETIVNPGDDAAVEATTVSREHDVSVTITESVDPVAAGAPSPSLTYVVIARNFGPSGVSGLTLDVATTLPAGVVIEDIIPSAGVFADPTWTVGELGNGASETLTIQLGVSSAAADGSQISCGAGVTAASGTLLNPGDDSALEVTTVIAEADLELAAAQSVDPVVAGSGAGNLVHTVTVTNHGPSDALATAVDIAVVLPAGATLDSVVPSAGGWADPVWTVGDLASGASASVELVYTVGASAAAGGAIELAAAATASVSLVNPTNDAVAVSTLVDALTDLELDKSDGEDPLVSGPDLAYTLEVLNHGPSDSTGATVVDMLPAEASFVSASPGCVHDSGTVTCALSGVAAGASALLVIEVTVDPTAPFIDNTASVAADEPDPVPGNDADTERTTLDVVPPQVDHLLSTASDDDGVLDECDTITGEIVTLGVVFDEIMHDPPGDTEPLDVTSPDAYLLVGAGPDADIDTVDCSGVLGDDIAVPVDAVGYSAASSTATLSFPYPVTLSHDLHRFVLCADRLADRAGNLLDGDGNGSPGDHHVTTFRVDAHNLFDNGHLDCSLDAWTAVSTLPEEIEYDPADVDDSSLSGSAHITYLAPQPYIGVSQCRPLDGAHDLTLAAEIALHPTSNYTATIHLQCLSFDTTDCSGAPVDGDAAEILIPNPSGAWLHVEAPLLSAEATASIACDVLIVDPEGGFNEAYLDNLHLFDHGPAHLNAIFTDGFESGTTSAWSSSTP